MKSIHYSIKYKNFLPKDSGLLKYTFELPVTNLRRDSCFWKKIVTQDRHPNKTIDMQITIWINYANMRTWHFSWLLPKINYWFSWFFSVAANILKQWYWNPKTLPWFLDLPVNNINLHKCLNISFDIIPTSDGY